jgi:hypothetical protein
MTINPTPDIPVPISVTPGYSDIKVATPNLIDFNESNIPTEAVVDLLFEDVGAQELIGLARTDLINGQADTYLKFKNIQALSREYSPLNMLVVPPNSESLFYNMAINIQDFLPESGTGPNGETVYIDESKNIIINLSNLTSNENVEIQVLTSGNITDNIVY